MLTAAALGSATELQSFHCEILAITYYCWISSFQPRLWKAIKYNAGLWIWFCFISCISATEQELFGLGGTGFARTITLVRSVADGTGWSSDLLPDRHLPSLLNFRVTTSMWHVMGFLRRAIARRIISLPRRARCRTRWRISGAWCGSGSATPSWCSPKFRRGSRYVSHSHQLCEQRQVAVNTCKMWAWILES